MEVLRLFLDQHESKYVTVGKGVASIFLKI